MQSPNWIELHTQSIKWKKNESWPCPFFKLWISHIHLKEVWVCDFALLCCNEWLRKKDIKISTWNCKLLGTMACFIFWYLQIVLVVAGTKPPVWNLEKRNSEWGEVALCITKFPKALEKKELASHPPHFICFCVFPFGPSASEPV